MDVQNNKLKKERNAASPYSYEKWIECSLLLQLQRSTLSGLIVFSPQFINKRRRQFICRSDEKGRSAKDILHSWVCKVGRAVHSSTLMLCHHHHHQVSHPVYWPLRREKGGGRCRRQSSYIALSPRGLWSSVCRMSKDKTVRPQPRFEPSCSKNVITFFCTATFLC